MEQTIGNLGEEICQPSNLYANLSQCSITRAQVNALRVACPDLGSPMELLEENMLSIDLNLGRGFILLHTTDRNTKPLNKIVKKARSTILQAFWKNAHLPTSKKDFPPIKQWARLQLPNKQIVWYRWKESLIAWEKTQYQKNVKVRIYTFQLLPSHIPFRSNLVKAFVLQRLYSSSVCNSEKFGTPLRLFHYTSSTIKRYITSHSPLSSFASTEETMHSVLYPWIQFL